MTASLATSCSESSDVDVEAGFGVAWSASFKTTNGESVAMRSSSEADYTLALTNSVMKIYDTDDRLLRRYEPISEAPDYIYLTEGDYYMTIVAGESVNPTDNSEEITFEGSANFSVSAAQSSSILVNCTMKNNMVAVTLASSIADNMEEGYKVTVAQADEVDESVEADTYIYKRVFTESGVTYFIQPTDDTPIAWKFEGVRKMSGDEVEGEVITKSGVIEDVAAGESNYLSFSYDKELVVSTAVVSVDTTTDDKNDIFEFSPQPTIVGSDFNIDDIQIATSGAFTMNIDAIYDISNINISYNGATISPLVGGEVQSVEGASYVVTNATSGVLTIDNVSYFGDITSGAEHTLQIEVSDIKASTTTNNLIVTTMGIKDLTNYDFWTNRATVSAYVTESSPESVEVRYCSSDDTNTWYSVPLTASEGYLYTAEVAPQWSEEKNAAGLTHYVLGGEGVFPNKSYTCKLYVNGAEYSSSSFTSADQRQTIPDGDLNDTSLACYSSSNGGSTWDSGNNSLATGLCSDATIDGSVCAKMTTSETAGVIAAGNIFYGGFKFNGILDSPSLTGYVSFGRAFTWTSRPRTMKVKYAATLKSGSITAPDGTKYSQDRGRIFMAIVNWSAQQVVTAGASGDATGTWDPTSQTSADNGKIIGYASTFIDASTSTSTLTQLELPIYYYDTETKPSGNYTLVISCASSAYGDYKIGVDGSVLYVDDFEFGY